MNKLKKRITALAISCVTLVMNTSWVFATERGVVNCNLLNVRVSPNTNCEIVDRMPSGTSFDIIYTDNGWYNIRMQNGITGFVCADYVRKVTDTASVVGETITNNIVKEIIDDANSFIGYPYSYGSAGPKAFDCSGLTSYIFKQQGISLPRSSYDQGHYGTYVEKSNLIPGDLVFFSNRSDRRINHVGVYIGNNEFIHAATSRRGVVKDSLTENYYINHYVTSRRVL